MSKLLTSMYKKLQTSHQYQVHYDLFLLINSCLSFLCHPNKQIYKEDICPTNLFHYNKTKFLWLLSCMFVNNCVIDKEIKYENKTNHISQILNMIYKLFYNVIN